MNKKGLMFTGPIIAAIILLILIIIGAFNIEKVLGITAIFGIFAICVFILYKWSEKKIRKWIK
jgi:hypothetical protein